MSEFNFELLEQYLSKRDEGLTLGLGAVAEMLQKMDARLEKQEMMESEEEERKRMEDEDAAREADKQAMIASIKEAVVKQLIDLQGDKAFKVSGGDKWPMSRRPAAEDKEVESKPRTDTEEVQKPIQAMQKQNVPVAPIKADLPTEEEEMPVEEEKPEAMEYPKEENDYPEEIKAVLTEMKMLKKSLDTVKSENDEIKKSFDEKVKKGVETQMKKLGFREEKTTAPKVTKSLGIDEPLAKSETASPEDLHKLPWNQLITLKLASESGVIEGGIPKEILTGGS